MVDAMATAEQPDQIDALLERAAAFEEHEVSSEVTRLKDHRENLIDAAM